MRAYIQIIEAAGYHIRNGIIFISDVDFKKETLEVKEAILELCNEWDCCCEDPK